MTKTFCDRCDQEITDQVNIVQFGSRRVLQDQMTLAGQKWELCDSCIRDAKRLLSEGAERLIRASQTP